MIKPASKIKLIIKFTTISELELWMEKRLKGTLMDLKELNKITIGCEIMNFCFSVVMQYRQPVYSTFLPTLPIPQHLHRT